jgi:hypothetical protein
MTLEVALTTTQVFPVARNCCLSLLQNVVADLLLNHVVVSVRPPLDYFQRKKGTLK